ncbi:hypothetical protein ACFQRL_01300 [Microbacterium fluvii]|uniref:DUF4190 domain-containing protein n=1 Tax=Microbacterium fluvii TaxID=415215 RepID=A0ABW2HCK2_9MICO|nr:hypothetical protein [Microbacterium fluvii]MCU4671223.1 hypothetical protein [Microbacterium fluvii]
MSRGDGREGVESEGIESEGAESDRAARSAARAQPAAEREAAASAPVIDAASPDIVLGAETRLPGAHSGGFSRLPTGPVDISEPTGPTLDLPPDAELRWYMPDPAPPRRGMAGWALGFSIVGLAVSLFVGWGFPIGIAGIVSAIIALRRPLEPRGVAIWAIVLGTLSILYSAGWLLWAASRTNLLG